MRKTKLTPEQQKELLKEYPHKSNQYLAEKYGVKDTYICLFATNKGVKKTEEYLLQMAIENQRKSILHYDIYALNEFKKLYPVTKDIDLKKIYKCSTRTIYNYKNKFQLEKTEEFKNNLRRAKRGDRVKIEHNDSSVYEKKLEFAKKLGFRNLGNCIAKLGLKEFELQYKNQQ